MLVPPAARCPSTRLLLARATLGFLSGAAAVEVAFVADLTSKTDRVDWVNMQTSHLVRKKWGTDASQPLGAVESMCMIYTELFNIFFLINMRIIYIIHICHVLYTYIITYRYIYNEYDCNIGYDRDLDLQTNHMAHGLGILWKYHRHTMLI